MTRKGGDTCQMRNGKAPSIKAPYPPSKAPSPIKAPWLSKGGCQRVVAKRVVAKGWLQKGGCKRVHLLIDSLENTDRTDPTRCRTTPTRTGQDQHGPELLQHGPDLPTRNTRIPNTHADQQHAARANTARARTARSMSAILFMGFIYGITYNF